MENDPIHANDGITNQNKCFSSKSGHIGHLFISMPIMNYSYLFGCKSKCVYMYYSEVTGIYHLCMCIIRVVCYPQGTTRLLPLARKIACSAATGDAAGMYPGPTMTSAWTGGSCDDCEYAVARGGDGALSAPGSRATGHTATGLHDRAAGAGQSVPFVLRHFSQPDYRHRHIHPTGIAPCARHLGMKSKPRHAL